VAGSTRLISPAARLRHNSITRGFLGGDRRWMAVGVLMWGPVLLRKLFGRNVEILSTEVLRPGQAVRIEAIPPPTRSERKAARRAR
jgi:hypothetical protein